MNRLAALLWILLPRMAVATDTELVLTQAGLDQVLGKILPSLVATHPIDDQGQTLENYRYSYFDERWGLWYTSVKISEGYLSSSDTSGFLGCTWYELSLKDAGFHLPVQEGSVTAKFESGGVLSSTWSFTNASAYATLEFKTIDNCENWNIPNVTYRIKGRIQSISIPTLKVKLEASGGALQVAEIPNFDIELGDVSVTDSSGLLSKLAEWGITLASKSGALNCSTLELCVVDALKQYLFQDGGARDTLADLANDSIASAMSLSAPTGLAGISVTPSLSSVETTLPDSATDYALRAKWKVDVESTGTSSGCADGLRAEDPPGSLTLSNRVTHLDAYLPFHLANEIISKAMKQYSPCLSISSGGSPSMTLSIAASGTLSSGFLASSLVEKGDQVIQRSYAAQVSGGAAAESTQDVPIPKGIDAVATESAESSGTLWFELPYTLAPSVGGRIQVTGSASGKIRIEASLTYQDGKLVIAPSAGSSEDLVSDITACLGSVCNTPKATTLDTLLDPQIQAMVTSFGSLPVVAMALLDSASGLSIGIDPDVALQSADGVAIQVPIQLSVD